ncbi:ATP-dependent helicase HrpB [Sediminicoccus sp. KRV36]|uniref:ATP-dependent helicase HrpB n=1 Tax=Sediminicoccus sp. KRV36 TaxID=3133721 RepID=UPI00200D280E|nr:ATP-dependent helicase HrpB [Sediminicoccus rosea]UPY38068.1 ATP-dependent helicase HrpB [Sediminicoccus rosea]
MPDHLAPDLPVTEALPALRAALNSGSNAVLVAPPGAGKTTLVPLVLREEPWAQGQKILVLEPRRVAARAAARRMAALLGEQPGGVVGLSTRLDRAVSAATRIEVITEGLLVRRLQSDPGLEGVAAVFFDEAHERHLDTDLGLALCLDLQAGLRPELRLLAMSATLDGGAFTKLMNAPLIESAGRAHPVRVEHVKRDITDPRDLPEAMAVAIRGIMAREGGDVLAFLPGWGEIRRTAERLSGLDADVLPLHGELSPAEQDRALNPLGGRFSPPGQAALRPSDAAPRRRVVLATSIAETSLTVPGVRIVVDGGYRRAPRLDGATGLTRLVTLRISRAAAEQRAGRAGRTEPGVAVRLWSEAVQRGMPLQDRPEMLEAELSSLVLDCAGWGADPLALPFLDPPPAGQLAAARALLRNLDAMDAAGRITVMGKRMARMGTHPRLARMMCAVENEGEAALAADLAALLEERDPLRGREPPADITLRLDVLHGHAHAESDGMAIRSIRRSAAMHRRRLGVHGNTLPEGDAGALLAAGFPDRIALKRGTMDGAFRLASGQGARISGADPLAKQTLLAVADLELKGTEARIRMAAPISRAVLEARFPERFVTVEGAAFDARAGAVLARRRVMFGPLVLEETPLARADPAAMAEALAEAAAERGLRDLDWSEAAKQLRARIARMHALEGPPWPDVSDAALAASAKDWLAPYCNGLTKLVELKSLDVAPMLLAHDLRRKLDAALPARIELPQGRSAGVDYSAEIPTLEARAQHLYGMGAMPPLAGGRIPLQVALLSPAGRPIAITADLASFWRHGWADARKDMRGRYPKHDWPEMPG